MGYRRAEEILPVEIIALIQQYADGINLYIPRKEDTRRKWGANTQIRQELLVRNRAIYEEHCEGMRVSELAMKYFLSEKSIQRIIRNMNDKRD